MVSTRIGRLLAQLAALFFPLLCREKWRKIEKTNQSGSDEVAMRSFLGFLGLLTALAIVPFAPAQEKAKPLFKLTAAEQKLLDLTNAERKKEKLPLLQPNPLLFQVARAHARNMAKQEKLEHELDGKSPFDRLSDAAYDYRRAAENIGRNLGDAPAAGLLKLWMESETHRANILNEHFTEIGLGFAINGKGEVYATQIFATPLKKE